MLSEVEGSYQLIIDMAKKKKKIEKHYFLLSNFHNHVTIFQQLISNF